jgi:hypothetical protein
MAIGDACGLTNVGCPVTAGSPGELTDLAAEAETEPMFDSVPPGMKTEPDKWTATNAATIQVQAGFLILSILTLV